MSELTTLEGLNIDFAMALKDSGIAVAPVVGGAVLETFKIERLKLDPSRKVRVAFLMNGGLAFKQHYVKNFGNVLCDGGECCKRLKSIADVQDSSRVLFPVVEYLVADPVRANLKDISVQSVKVKVLSIHSSTYNKRMADSFASPLGVSQDWVLVATSGEFAGGLESMSPVGNCLFKQVPEVFEYVQQTLKENISHLWDAIGSKFDVNKFEDFLKNPQTTGSSAPATPKAPAVGGDAVNMKALQDEFAL